MCRGSPSHPQWSRVGVGGVERPLGPEPHTEEEGQPQLPAEALARARQARIRLCERHRHLTRNGKPQTVATADRPVRNQEVAA